MEQNESHAFKRLFDVITRLENHFNPNTSSNQEKDRDKEEIVADSIKTKNEKEKELFITEKESYKKWEESDESSEYESKTSTPMLLLRVAQSHDKKK